MLAPAFGTVQYEQAHDDQLEKLTKLLEQRKMVIGQLHQDSKRVSIIFQGGQVFSFQLVESEKWSEKGSWFGQVGNHRDIKLTDFVYNHLDGSVKGQWESSISTTPHQVSGTMDIKNVVWVGYIEIDNQKHYLEFRNFTVQKQEKVEATSTKHQYAEQIQVICKVDAITPDHNDNSISFTEAFTLNGIKRILSYKGQLNSNWTRIDGEWGKDNAAPEGKFCLQILSHFMLEKNNPKLRLTLNQFNQDSSIQRNKSLEGYVNFEQSNILNDASQAGKDFIFLAINQKNRAQTWLKSFSIESPQFSCAEVDGKQRLLVVGNIRIQQTIEKKSGYNVWGLDVLDLDAELIDPKQSTSQVQKQKVGKRGALSQTAVLQDEPLEQAPNIYKIEFQLPTLFRQITDKAGNLKLPPLTILPFTIQFKRDAKNVLAVNDNQMRGQLFFRDPFTKTMQLMFVEGSSASKKDVLIVPRWPSSQSEDVIVQYPILAYKTQLASNNEIVFVNLIKNQSQKLVNIEPFTFVQFLDTGLKPERFLYNSPHEINLNTCIFFLVELDGVLRVMYYKVFPFDLDQEGYVGFQQEDSIQILSGSLDLKQFDHDKKEAIQQEIGKPADEVTAANQGFITDEGKDGSNLYQRQNFTNEKIMSATLLQRMRVDGVEIMVVIQFLDGIFYFSLDKKEKFGGLKTKQGNQMIQLLMQRGPKEEIYFGETISKVCDTIVRITFNDANELKKTTVLKLESGNLIGLQVVPAEVYDDDEFRAHSLLAIDDQQNYIKIDCFCKGNGIRAFETEVISLKDQWYIDSLMQSLQQNPWSRFTGSKRGFTFLEDKEVSTNYSQTVATTVSLTGDFRYNEKVYKFDEDKKLSNHIQELAAQKPKSNNLVSVRQVPWMQKTLYEVKDENYNYYMVKGSKFTNQFQLMMPDMQKRLMGTPERTHSDTSEMIFLGNLYIAIPIHQISIYLIFRQSDLGYWKTIPFKNFKCCSPIEAKIQYFQGQFKDDQQTICKLIVFNQEKLIFTELLNLGALRATALKQTQKLINKLVDGKSREHDIHRKNIFQGFYWPLGIMSFFVNLPTKMFHKEKLDYGEVLMNLRDNVSFNAAKNIGSQLKDNLKENYGELKQTLGAKSVWDLLDMNSVQMKKQVKVNLFKMSFESDPEINKCTNLFLIESDYFDDDKSLEFIFSENYIIIQQGLKLLYRKFDDQEMRDHLANHDDKKIKDAANLQDILNNSTPLIFTAICIEENIASSITSEGMKVQLVSPQDNDIVEQIEVRSDLIQISFQNLAMVWDLNENKEISFVEVLSQFASSQNYVSTGFVPYTFHHDKSMGNSRYLTYSPDKSMMLQSPLTVNELPVLFRQFCELDLIEIIYLQQCEQSEILVKQIDFETVLANFDGLTFFEIFQYNEDYIEQVLKQITDQELKEKKFVDASGSELDNTIIRRMYYTMLLPLVKPRQENNPVKQVGKETKPLKNNIKNILVDKLTDPEGSYMLDPLLRLVMFSDECKLSNLVRSGASFKQVFSLKSATVTQFMSQSLFENQQTRELNQVRWNQDDQIISFGSETSQLSYSAILSLIQDEQINKAPLFKKIKAFIARAYKFMNVITLDIMVKNAESKKEYKNKLLEMNQVAPVQVRIMEIEWLDEFISELYVYMARQEDNQLFGNEFIKILLQQQNYTTQILYVMIPYMVYAAVSLAYLSGWVPVHECNEGFACQDEDGDNRGLWLRISIITLGGIFLLIEIRQIYISGWGYLEKIWKMVNFCSIVLNIIVVLEHSLHFIGMGYDVMLQVASIAVVIQWFMFYYWSRLSPELAHYVKFLQEVVIEISSFVCMFLISIFMFANAIYVLNVGKIRQQEGAEDGEEITQYVSKQFKNQFVDAMMDQYRIAIGSVDNMDTYDQPLIWIFYLCTTLWTQLTFFNMLVGIMSMSLEKVCEAKERNALREQTKMIADFAWLIKSNKKFKGQRYLYIVQPCEEEEGGQLAGSISGVKRAVKDLEKKMENIMKMQVTKIASQVSDSQAGNMSALADRIQAIEKQIKQSTKLQNSKLDTLLAAHKKF